MNRSESKREHETHENRLIRRFLAFIRDRSGMWSFTSLLLISYFDLRKSREIVKKIIFLTLIMVLCYLCLYLRYISFYGQQRVWIKVEFISQCNNKHLTKSLD